jgi:bifunctional non-homologous end joining protein LigD
MSLQKYHKKRDFSKTPEPAGSIEQRQRQQVSDTSTTSLRFVVQKHEARRLHYDFRLETHDRTLKSWAVPKGISLDPKVKRLAVMTEDHPLDYLLFEGVIPKGNYGAGTVIVWDTGHYTTEYDLSEQLEGGKIVFTLFGQKLKGRFSLIRTNRGKGRDVRQERGGEGEGSNQWLLIKANDEFASTEDLTVDKPESVITRRTNAELEHNDTKGRGIHSHSHSQESEQKIKIKINSEEPHTKEHLKNDYLNYEKQQQEQFPTVIKPMLGTLVNHPFDSKDWVFEIKWDGVRAILFFNKKRQIYELKSRNDKSITRRYPELQSSLEVAVNCKESIIVDGEIVVLDEKGYPNFQSHQRRMNVDSLSDINTLSNQIPATYYIFDILYLDGKNLQNLSFLDRRQTLSDVIIPNERVRISDFVEEKGMEMFTTIKKMNLEGIMAKRKTSKYLQGRRSADWLKIKNIKTQDCIVIGYTKGEGNRQNYFGSLLLAMYDEKEEAVFVGHTGSGFDFNLLDKIYPTLKNMKIDTCPIKYVPYTNNETFWIRPELVAEVKFHGWTNERIMRAPIFLRLRDDKSPKECRIEIESPLAEIVSDAGGGDNGSTATGTTNYPSQDINIKQSTTTITNNHNPDRQSNNNMQYITTTYKVSFSNLDKIFWMKTKEHDALTKKDLIDYYDRISDYILPYLKDRPLSLSRYPDGVSGKHFYHKNWDKEKPEYVETIKVYSESNNSTINYIVCNNKETLLWLANLGCIEMHPWYSRIRDFNSCKQNQDLDEDKCGLNFPDFIVFDLDPYIYSGYESKGEEPEYNVKGFKAAIEVACHLKDLFDNLNISSYLKTSGKTGLHIFVPIVSEYTYDQTRRFAEVIGSILVSKYPNKITTEWNTAKRKGKVFFDYNQNSKGKTIASVLSARPTTSATVSMPIRWKDLSSTLPTDFNLLNVPKTIKKVEDPWKNILQEKQDINTLLESVKQI